MLEGTPVIDHHGLAARARDPRDQLLHQDRLARPGLAGHGHVVVAGLVGEGGPARGLAPPSDQEQRRRRVRRRPLAAPLTVHRCEIDGRGGEQGLHPAHAGEIGVEPAGRDHGQTGEPGRQVGVTLGAQAPALAVIDGAHRLLGLVDGVQGRVDRDHVAGLDQPLAVLEPLGDEAPVLGLLGQARQVARDPRARLLRGPGREHAHRHVRPVRVVEDQARGRDGQGPARGRALKMNGVPGRPAPPPRPRRGCLPRPVGTPRGRSRPPVRPGPPYRPPGTPGSRSA